LDRSSGLEEHSDRRDKGFDCKRLVAGIGPGPVHFQAIVVGLAELEGSLAARIGPVAVAGRRERPGRAGNRPVEVVRRMTGRMQAEEVPDRILLAGRASVMVLVIDRTDLGAEVQVGRMKVLGVDSRCGLVEERASRRLRTGCTDRMDRS